LLSKTVHPEVFLVVHFSAPLRLRAFEGAH